MDTADLERVRERYRLVRLLGEGGMASVWAAEDLAQGGEVAISFLSAAHAGSAHVRARFEREAIALQQLAGPHVVEVHSHGVDQHGRQHIVMELLAGEDLQARLAREHRLGLAETAVFMGQIAAALQRAHAAGIVHRDLKPANVFIARTPSGEQVKLLDFGIAKLKREEGSPDEGATRTGMIFGTVAYMSPEQMQGARDVDHRTDVWSLGVIAFRALTGRLPFQGRDYPELFPKICYGPVPKPSEVAPDLGLSAEVDALFARVLEQDWQRRVQTAAELAAELARLAEGRPPVPVAGTMVLPSPEPPGDAPSKRGEPTAGGSTMQPVADAERGPTGVSTVARGGLAMLAAGIAGGALVAAVFVWRDRSAVQPVSTAAPVPVPTAPVTVTLDARTPPPTVAVTSTDTPALPEAPTSSTAPAPTSPPVPAVKAPPPTTGPTAHPTPPPASKPRPVVPLSRQPDPYCRAAYPDKPHASSVERPGCAAAGTKLCCP